MFAVRSREKGHPWSLTPRRKKSSHVSGMLAAGAIRALTLTQFFFHIHNTAGFM
jgi:hypothetical protein